MPWDVDFKRKLMTAADALRCVESGMRVYIHPGCAEPELLVDALMERAPYVRDVEIVSPTRVRFHLTEPFPDFKVMKPMVFAGIYPVETDDYPVLKDARITHRWGGPGRQNCDDLPSRTRPRESASSPDIS